MNAQAAELRLDPQFVVNQILGEGREAKDIELKAQAAYTDYYNNYAKYDWIFSGSATYEDSRKQILSGSGNQRDKTSIWSASLEKRIPTGTTFGVTYNRTIQNSIFRPSSTPVRSSYAVYDVSEISITQDILWNFLGIAERKTNEAADNFVKAAELQKKEDQENLVLESLELFWNSYVAKENLREALAQRDKYQDLVKEVEGKSRSGFVNPGDLPQARAEYGAQTRNVKEASYSYIENLDKLTTAMKIERHDEEIKFVVKEEIPALPTMVMPNVEGLRPVEIKKISFDAAELAKGAIGLSADLPNLYLVGKAGYTGLDATQSQAFASMSSSSHPVYSIALNLDYRFFSNKSKADKNNVNVGYERSFNDYLQAKEEQIRLVNTAMESVRLNYAAALSAIEEAKQWEEAVKAQERSYRQGRLDFSQLIQNYSKFFASRTTRIKAIGDYHIALHAYAAAVDQLVN